MGCCLLSPVMCGDINFFKKGANCLAMNLVDHTRICLCSNVFAHVRQCASLAIPAN